MNLPNQLTVGRFFLTLLFVAALSSSWAWAYTAGLVLFSLASITDYADGEIARRYNLVTDFGKLMDPLVDKIMMAAAFICLVPLGAFPPWVAIIIISREFLITGLRMLAASKGVLLPAENLGKHKTIWQIITVLYFLLLLCRRSLLGNHDFVAREKLWILFRILLGFSDVEHNHLAGTADAHALHIAELRRPTRSHDRGREGEVLAPRHRLRRTNRAADRHETGLRHKIHSDRRELEDFVVSELLGDRIAESRDRETGCPHAPD